MKKNMRDDIRTKISNIEYEALKYKKQFNGKTVFLNCDDAIVEGGSFVSEINADNSGFWNFFYLQFERLGLKKLIATRYNEEGSAHKLEYTGGGPENIIRTPLEGNGDFRSDESIELLKEADVVCTHPPFSLFKEYVAQLIEYDKEFLIMGGNNAASYKDIFPLIKDNKIWTGHHVNETMEFKLPDYSEEYDRIEKRGDKYKNISAITWFTNMEVKRIHPGIILCSSYENGIDGEYNEYDNFRAIDVSRVESIPRDFDGIMGVPMTFLSKYDPKQFEILGTNKWGKTKDLIGKELDILIDGEKIRDRVFIKRKKAS